MKKFLSRKLLLTVSAIGLVITSTLLGLPLDEQALKAITTMVLGLVGAQGLVDFGEAWTAGSAVAKALSEDDTDSSVSER